MKRLRDPNWVLTFVFVALIAAIPLAQTIMEAMGDEGVVAFELFNEKPTAVNLRNYEKRLETTSWAGRVSRPVIQFAQFGWLKYGGEKMVVARDGWYFFKPGLNYMLARPEIAKHGSATNDPVAAILDFRDQLAARGFKLLVVPVPNKDSVYPDRLSARAGKMRSVMAPRTREVMEKLRAANVEVVDLFAEFREAREKSGGAGTPLYLAQDTHWSPAGVNIAAKAVARRLNELGWVSSGKTEYSERAAPVERVGDIVKMLQAPNIERTVTPEMVSAVQVVRGDNGQLYKDDPNAEILVMGDSFMRIYQEDAPNGAGFIAHLAKELKQPVLSLVNDGGGATLVREELCARPIYLRHKKVVIWEFVERDIGLAVKGWQRTALPADAPKAAAADQSADRK
ncbi:MAG TPA: hypothetical protein VM680_00160 [Verrucomicrobiae bacterium]|nr:hypothetical protein [Verrucomicrobiae bacterium]